MSDTPVVEKGLAVGGLGITRRIILRSTDDMSFSAAIDSTAHFDDIRELLDRINDCVDYERRRAAAEEERARWENDLDQRRKALLINKESLGLCAAKIENNRVRRLTYIAAREAARSIGGRRNAWTPNEQQKGELQQFDEERESLRLEYANLVNDKPITEWEIASLEARLAGQEPPPRPPEIVEAASTMILPDAAE
jgi:hypothetical protein